MFFVQFAIVLVLYLGARIGGIGLRHSGGLVDFAILLWFWYSTGRVAN